MYKIIGQEILHGKRYGKYIVEFSCQWPSEAEHLYLVSSFTSYFPGRFVLSRHDDRGKVVVKLWEGVYPYRFASSCGTILLDSENPKKIKMKTWPDSEEEEEFSLAEVGVKEYLAAIENGKLEPELIIHDENDPAFINFYLGYTVIRLKTPKNVIENAYVETKNFGSIKMEKFYQNYLTDHFQAIVKGKVNSYRFLLETKNDRIYFGLNGLSDEEFITLENIIGISEPYWFIGSFYYLIFPDSFTRRKVALKGGRPRRRLGGSLKDISESLDYLKSLGVDAIYVTPIYKASSYHRYDVIDHEAIDEDLGSWSDWYNLVREAETRGISIMLDIVAHHLSPCSKEFRNAILDNNSKYRTWFKFKSNFEEEELTTLKEFVEKGCSDFPSELREKTPFYETFLCNWGMPKLNYSNPEVVQRLVNLASFWIKRGARGLRIDVGHAIPDEALRLAYREVKRQCEECTVILEVSRGVKYYQYGLTADSAMNYDLRGLLLDFFVRKSINAYELVKGIKEIYLSIPLYAANSMYNLLGSHDTPRIATLSAACGDACLKTLYVALFTMPGSPSVYYGDEIGMTGGNDPENRLPMVWDELEWKRDLLCLIKSLSHLRKELSPIRLGFFDARPIRDDAFFIRRWWENEEALIFFSRDRGLEVELPDEYIDVEAGERLRKIELKPYSWKILFAKKE